MGPETAAPHVINAGPEAFPDACVIHGTIKARARGKCGYGAFASIGWRFLPLD